MSVTFRPTDISKLSGKLVSLKVALISLLVVHFFGALGLAYEPLRDYFQMATPLNLLITALLLFSFHQAWNISFYIFATICFAIGYFVEVAGIHTGEIFGEYHYGPTLGFKIWDVPLIIGLNWLILVYCTGIIAHQFFQNIFLKSLAGSMLMVILDFFIEPVAVSLDFWVWEGGEIPLQNFIGWFITSYILQIFFHLSKFEKHNYLARYVIYVQLGFFIFIQSLI